MENFNKMFNLHPNERHKIIMHLNEVNVNRWQQSYLKTPEYELDTLKHQSYMYSGFDTSTNNNQLPDLFQKYYDYMKSTNDKYNQVVVNWYENENDHIAYHSDCEIGMIPNAEISIISLYEKMDDNLKNYRVFSIIPKNKEVTALHEKINIILRPDIIITMCGQTQKEFKHGIEQTENKVVPRISISFRQFV